MIRRNSYVCFEMDTDHHISSGQRGCDWGMKYSSILGYGNISFVTDKDQKITGMNQIMIHYGGEGEYLFDEKLLEQTTILRLKIIEMTGKKK